MPPFAHCAGQHQINYGLLDNIMKIAPLPDNEKERLEALNKYDILDTEPDTALNAMVHLASYICQTPIAAISLVDENRQ